MCIEATILIADDEPAVRDALARLLADEGYRLLFAEDGQQALSKAAEARPDLILLDILMPRLDGFEVCRRLRADPLLAQVPIVMITALDDRRSRLEGLEAGADDFISKPFDDLALLATVRTIVRLNRYRRLLEERKRHEQAEEALRQNETLLNATQRLTKVGGWEWDVEQQTMFWTDETYRIHGFDPQEIAPGSTEHIDRSLECYDPDDRTIIMEAFETCAREGKGYDFEFPFTTVQGQQKWIRTTGQAQKEHGKIVKVIGNLMDITERVRAQEALRESEGFLNAVFESIQDGISVLNPDLTIRHVNGVMKRWYSENLPLEGKYCHECYHNADRPCEPCPTLRCIETGETERDVVPGPADSPVEWIELFSYPMKDPDSDKVTGVVEFVRDITERVQAQEALRQRARELAALNAVSHRVTVSLLVDQVVAAALDEAVAATDPDLALVFLREEDRLLLREMGPSDAEYTHKETPIHRVGECLCGLAVSTGEALYSRDIRSDPRCTWEECKKAKLRSFAALPLRSGGEIIGVLGLASETERAFAEQAEFLETLAGGIAIGLRNAFLHEEIQRHAIALEERVAERTAELQSFVNLMAGREVRMAELKGVIRQLRAQLEEAGLTPAADDPLLGG